MAVCVFDSLETEASVGLERKMDDATRQIFKNLQPGVKMETDFSSSHTNRVNILPSLSNITNCRQNHSVTMIYFIVFKTFIILSFSVFSVSSLLSSIYSKVVYLFVCICTHFSNFHFRIYIIEVDQSCVTLFFKFKCKHI